MPLTEKSQAGFQINYEKIDGILPATTLFVHGNLASNRWWYPSQDEFKKRAGGKSLKGSMLLAEFRGCGKSTPPRTVEDSDMHVMAQDFISLLRGLNLGPVNLVGHSTGGLLAALMLAKAPELFNKAVLLDSVGARGIKFDNSILAAFEAMKTDKNLTATVIGSTIHKNNPESYFFKTVLAEDAFHAVKTVGPWVLKNLDGLDIRNEIAQISHPVLVLHGEHDLLLPIADSKELAASLKNGQFKMIEGQGHCANVENPAKFVEIAAQFLFT